MNSKLYLYLTLISVGGLIWIFPDNARLIVFTIIALNNSLQIAKTILEIRNLIFLP